MRRWIGVLCSTAMLACGCAKDRPEEHQKVESAAAATEKAPEPSPSPPAAVGAPPPSAPPPVAPPPPARVTVIDKTHAALLALVQNAKQVKTCAIDLIDAKPAGDVVLSKERPAVFSGWAADLTSPMLFGAVRLVLEADGAWYQGPGQRGTQRPDVAAVFNNPLLAASGFHSTLDVTDVPPGTYKVKIFQIMGPDETTLCDTLRTVTIP